LGASQKYYDGTAFVGTAYGKSGKTKNGGKVRGSFPITRHFSFRGSLRFILLTSFDSIWAHPQKNDYPVGYKPGMYARSYSNVWGKPDEGTYKSEPCKPAATTSDGGKSGKTKGGAGYTQFRLFGSKAANRYDSESGLAAPSMDGWEAPAPPSMQGEWAGPKPHGQGWTYITHGKGKSVF